LAVDLLETSTLVGLYTPTLCLFRGRCSDGDIRNHKPLLHFSLNSNNLSSLPSHIQLGAEMEILKKNASLNSILLKALTLC